LTAAQFHPWAAPIDREMYRALDHGVDRLFSNEKYQEAFALLEGALRFVLDGRETTRLRTRVQKADATAQGLLKAT
jgi:hypothetical protein